MNNDECPVLSTSSELDEGLPSTSEQSITLGTYQVWSGLPEEIKQDPSLAHFREGYERHVQGQSLPRYHQSVQVEISSKNYDVAIAPEVHIVPPSDDSTPQSSKVAPVESPFSMRSSNSGILITKQFADSGIAEEEKTTSSKFQKLKMVFLCSLWLLSTFGLTVTQREAQGHEVHDITVPPNKTKSYFILSQPNMRQVSLELQGALVSKKHISNSTRHLYIWIELILTDSMPNISRIKPSMVYYRKKITNTWEVPLVSDENVGVVPEVRLKQTFDLTEVEHALVKNSVMCLQFSHNLKKSYPLSININLSPIDPKDGVAYAALVLIGLYFLIIFDIIHRTLAAMLASTISLAILALLGEKPTQMDVITWIDIESLLLLFSMMVMVALFAETGIFDYLAVVAYKWTNGRMWSLINVLCIFTVVVSALLDSVTTVLLMTPVTIRLCEVMELNPVPILMAMIMYSNIGGAVTPIGDPPNLIIATNLSIQAAGVSFLKFTIHMGLCLIFVMFCVYFQLRFIMFRNIKMLRFKEPQDIQELRHEIAIWTRAANSLSSCSKDEDTVRETLLMKITRLGAEMKKKVLNESIAIETYTSNLEQIESKFKIRNKILLMKSMFILLFVIISFFMSSSTYLNLPIGGTAILGAMLLLMIADREDIESILSKVEWSTLIFFSALFIVMEALARLGLIDFIGHHTEQVILKVDKEWRLAAAIMLILWVSALVSSFIDNIPLTTMMIRIVISLSQNQELKLPLQPLVWSLALGACLGGNGTFIGSSSNVVCAGVAEQHGYKFTFMEFSRIGFPVMIFSIVCATVYLMIAHVLIGWNY